MFLFASSWLRTVESAVQQNSAFAQMPGTPSLVEFFMRIEPSIGYVH